MESMDEQRIPKPDDAEEEEEEYVPPVRSHRYVYKFHRIGSLSSEQIAGPAQTPPLTRQEAISEVTSSSTTHGSVITETSGTVTHETVAAESTQEHAVAGGAEFPKAAAAEIPHPRQVAGAEIPHPEQPAEAGIPHPEQAAEAGIPHPEQAAGAEIPHPEQVAGTEIPHPEQPAEAGIPHPEQAAEAGIPHPEQAAEAGIPHPEQAVGAEILHPEQAAEAGIPHPEQAAGAEIPHPEQVAGTEIPHPEQPAEAGIPHPEQAAEAGIPHPEQPAEAGIPHPEQAAEAGTPHPEQAAEAGIPHPEQAVGAEILHPEQAAEAGIPHPERPAIFSETALLTDGLVSTEAVPNDTAPIEGTLYEAPGTHELVSGITEEGNAVIFGIASSRSEILEDGAAQKITDALTSERNEIGFGLSTEQGSKDIPVEGQPPLREVISGLTTASEKVVAGLALDNNMAAIESESTRIPSGSVTTTAPVSNIPSETSATMADVSDGIKEVISGVTNENVVILSGLSTNPAATDVDFTLPAPSAAIPMVVGSEHQQLSEQPESVISKACELPATMVIVSGLTNDGFEIISGLAFRHNLESSTTTSELANHGFQAGTHTDDTIKLVHAENDATVPEAIKHVVSGLASIGERIIAGVVTDSSSAAMEQQVTADVNCVFEKPTEAIHAEVPSVEVQKAPKIDTDSLQSDRTQEPPNPFNLPPMDVPLRSDSF